MLKQQIAKVRVYIRAFAPFRSCDVSKASIEQNKHEFALWRLQFCVMFYFMFQSFSFNSHTKVAAGFRRMGPFSLELSYFRSLNEIKRLLRPRPLFCAIILRYSVRRASSSLLCPRSKLLFIFSHNVLSLARSQQQSFNGSFTFRKKFGI